MVRPNRRTVIKSIGAAGITLMLPENAFCDRDERPNHVLKFGVIADLHGGFVRDAEARLTSFLTAMKSEACNALIQLGDFAFPNDQHQKFADQFNAVSATTLHVIGNHEFDYGLKRQDCYDAWGIEASYYRKDVDGLRVLVLDGNDEGSPKYKEGYHSYVGKAQLVWLEKQLKDADRPVLILSHQPLAGNWAVDNAADIQKLLAQHKDKILLCMNGHSHIDLLVEVDGVSYLHVNSASYFWVGGKHRTAFYKEPLFSTVSIDYKNRTIEISGKKSSWKSLSPKDMGYFETKKDAPPPQAVVPEIRDQKIS